MLLSVDSILSQAFTDSATLFNSFTALFAVGSIKARGFPRYVNVSRSPDLIRLITSPVFNFNCLAVIVPISDIPK